MTESHSSTDRRTSKLRNQIVTTSCPHDCGGRCILRVHVQDGKIVRIESDNGEEPQIRACLRGRAYRQRVYAPDRLAFPLKRQGERGDGQFRRISWREALDTVADELKRIKDQYGSSAILYIGYAGSIGCLLHNKRAVSRLLNMFGGFTETWGSASSEGSHFSSKITYGTSYTGNTRDDLVNSRLIILWGLNPAVTIQTLNTNLNLAIAKEKGVKIISVDPRFTDSAATFAQEWIPIRPGTDTAMLLAMAYVIINEHLHDQRFLDTYTTGFNRFRDYVRGSEDGVAKTPEWAETITGVSAVNIKELAKEYANSKPAALMMGFAPGRTAYGEQAHRAAAILAAMTGNVGIMGGNAAGHGWVPVGFIQKDGQFPGLPEGSNPVKEKIHISKLWDAILGGRAKGYPADIKLLYVTNGNPLNQFPNINKGVKAFNKLEFIVTHEQFMTATARYSDIVLPINTHLERNDLVRPWGFGAYYIYQKKAINSLHESKSDFDICCELATRLGIERYSDKSEDEWLRELFRVSENISRDVSDYDAFKEKGVHKIRVDKPIVTFEKQIEDPEKNPFPTPSGKIEIYSQQLADLNNPRLPPIPKYIEPWEGPKDKLVEKYPLQLITTHFRTRTHSIFDNIPWLKQVEPHAIWINTADARRRNIKNGGKVLVFNDKGSLVIRAKVTERIMPGVVCIPEGAWFNPDKKGVDRGGSPNVLFRDKHSPCGAFCSNTCLVQIENCPWEE